MQGMIRLTSMCNKEAFPVLNQPQLVYVLIEVAPGAAFAPVYLPRNFALLLDSSYSMDASGVPASVRRLMQQDVDEARRLGEPYSISWDGSRLRTVKEAVCVIIDQLQPDDIYSVVAFAERPQVLIPAQPPGNKSAAKKKVLGIRAQPSTSIALALAEGISQVSRYHSPERVNRIVMLTDGEPTDSEIDSRRMADRAGQMGVPLICLGLGEDWNVAFLSDLAARSSQGLDLSADQVYYIRSPQDVHAIFQQVNQSMQVVAQNVAVNVRMVQGLEARKVWQVVPMIKDIGRSAIQGRAIVIPVGELEAGGAAYLAEVMLPPRLAGMVRIAQTDATYDVPGQGRQREAVDLVVTFSQDALQTNVFNGHVMNVVEKVQAFKLQTQAIDEADMGNVRGATQKLRQAVTILLSQGETELAQQMEQEADQLEQSGQISSEGKKTITLTSRKTVRLSN